MITRRGIGFVIIGVSVFFVASATRVGWLHVADALLWGIIALSAVLPWITVPKLHVDRHISIPRRRGDDVSPVVGEFVDVKLTISNATRWPRFFVSAHQSSSTGGAAETTQRYFFAGLRSHTASSSTGQVECDMRGWRDFGDVMLESRLPFGLFRRRKWVGAPGRVLVYPRWLEMERIGLVGAAFGDEASRRRARRGDEMAGSRRYVAGDSMRDIHWKNTARTGRAAVKQYDAGAEESLIVGFDSAMVYGDGGDGADTTLEYAASIVASVCKAVTRRGGAVRLAIDGQLSQPSMDWPEIMGLLATVERNPAGGFPSAAHRILPDQRVFAVISGRDRASASALESLARRGASVAALVLEGFAAGDAAAPVLRSLQAAHVQAIAGRKGAIEDAIQLIETGGQSRVAPRPVETAPRTVANTGATRIGSEAPGSEESPGGVPPQKLAA